MRGYTIIFFFVVVENCRVENITLTICINIILTIPKTHDIGGRQNVKKEEKKKFTLNQIKHKTSSKYYAKRMLKQTSFNVYFRRAKKKNQPISHRDRSIVYAIFVFHAVNKPSNEFYQYFRYMKFNIASFALKM